MENIDNTKLIVATIVLFIWLSLMAYYLYNIFMDYRKPKSNTIPDFKLSCKPPVNNIDVNDSETLSTEHQSFLNVVHNSTITDENVSIKYELKTDKNKSHE